MKDKKLVSNLLTNIGKVRDIIARADYKELRQKQFFVEKNKE